MITPPAGILGATNNSVSYSEVYPVDLPRGAIIERLGGGELHQLLAHIAAMQHANEGTRRILDAIHDIFAVFELSGLKPQGQFLQCGGIAVGELKSQESLGARLPDQQVGKQSGSGLWVFQIVLGDLAADRNPCMGPEKPENGIGNRPTDVVEIDIDAVRTDFVQGIIVVFDTPVVEGRITGP